MNLVNLQNRRSSALYEAISFVYHHKARQIKAFLSEEETNPQLTSKKERGSVSRSLHIRSPVLIHALNSQSNLKSAVPLKQYCLMQIATVKPPDFISHPYHSPVL